MVEVMYEISKEEYDKGQKEGAPTRQHIFPLHAQARS